MKSIIIIDSNTLKITTVIQINIWSDVFACYDMHWLSWLAGYVCRGNKYYDISLMCIWYLENSPVTADYIYLQT